MFNDEAKLEISCSCDHSLFISFSFGCKLKWACLVLFLLPLCATHPENIKNPCDILSMEFQLFLLKMSTASLTAALSPLTPFGSLPLSCCFHKKKHAHCTHVHVHTLGKQL